MADNRRRRQRGEGTVHRRTVDGKPRGYAGQIDLGVINGRRIRKSVYGPTQDAVIKKMREMRRQLDETGALPTTDMTVEKWLKFWLNNLVAERVKPKTFASYRTAVTHHICPSIGSVRLSKLTAQHVRTMDREIAARLSTSTARLAHRILSIALNDAAREKKVAYNVAKDARPPSNAVSVRKNLTAAQAITVLTKAGNLNDAMAARWLIALLYGPRQGECLGLRWSDIGPDTIDIAWSLSVAPWEHGCDGTCGKGRAGCPHRRIVIPNGVEHTILYRNIVLMRPKNDASIRVVPLIPIIEAALELRREQVERDRPNYLVDHDLVFATPTGDPITPRNDYQAWQDLLGSAGLPHATLHAARHTTATLLLELGVDAKVIGSILGHSDIITTRAYQHVDTSLARLALTGLTDRLAVEPRPEL